MKFSLQYLDKVDLIEMDELPPDYFKESSHNQILALIGSIYSGNPASKGRNCQPCKLQCSNNCFI